MIERGSDLMKNDAEIIRIRYKYRKLIMQGRVKLPYEEAVKLIGPDCAYHLYLSLKNRSHDGANMRSDKKRKKGDPIIDFPKH
jgi:hypothetical protein